MTEQEQAFKQSILNKISQYKIDTTFNECLKHAKNKFINTTYYNKTQELIDVGIEKFLCQKSPYYFISNYCSFTLPGVGELPGSNLYYYQKEILKDFLNWNKIVLTKSRQTGLSTLSSLMFFWKVIFFPKEWGVIISKDSKSSQDVLEKIKENLKNIPSWLGLKVTINNTKGLKFSNGSKIDSFARSKSAGRGTSPTFALLDEFAFYQTKNIADGIISSIVPSVSKTGGQLLIVSTPNGTTGEGELYYKQVMELRNAGGRDETTKSILYDVRWWECPDGVSNGPKKGYDDVLNKYIALDYFNNPEVKKEANDFFTPIAEKPKENQWLSFQYTSSGEVKYRQEILQDFVVMGNSVFSAKIIESALNKTIPPKYEGDLLDRYYKGLWVWQKVEEKHRYAIGADVAKGTADDSTAVQVMDVDTNNIVAEFLGRISTKEAGKLINDLGHYYNEAYVIVECNSIGEAVFNELYYNYCYNNMYKMKKINKNDKSMVWTGWMTTTKTRELITDNFIDIFGEPENSCMYGFNSSRLIEQCKTWVWSGGRPDHTEGSHDDAIFALAILLYNLPKAKQILSEAGQKKTVFIAEDGREINGLENIDFNDNTTYEERKKFAENLGIPDNIEEDALSVYNWLIG